MKTLKRFTQFTIQKTLIKLIRTKENFVFGDFDI